MFASLAVKKRKKRDYAYKVTPVCVNKVRGLYLASTRKTSTIKLGRRSLVGVGRILKRAICSFQYL